jgi:hypothetical protein
MVKRPIGWNGKRFCLPCLERSLSAVNLQITDILSAPSSLIEPPVQAGGFVVKGPLDNFLHIIQFTRVRGVNL